MLARRLAAYSGVMAARVLALHQDESGEQRAPSAQGGGDQRVSDAQGIAELASLGMLEH